MNKAWYGARRRAFPGFAALVAGLMALACLVLSTSAARAATTAVTGAAGSVTINGSSPAPLAFPLARMGDSAYAVWARYQTADGTAMAGTDYTAASGAFEIPAGATTAALPIQALGASSPPATST